MDDLTWEWTLATNEKIIARVDSASGVESIYVGQRLVSRSGHGGKPEGHNVVLGSSPSLEGAYRAATPQELLAKFDPALQHFELRANGQVVPPARAPHAPPSGSAVGRVYGHVPLPRYAPSPPPPSHLKGLGYGKTLGLIVGVVVGALLSVAGVRKYSMGARVPDAPAGALASSTHLVTVHYPAGFRAKEETKVSTTPATRDDDCHGRTCTVEVSLLKMESVTHDEGVFVAAFKMNGVRIGRDPWRVSNLLHERFQDFVKVRGSDYVETDRQDGTCLGEAGAIVTGRFREKGEDGTMWSCTFIRDGNAFWVTSFLNVKDAADASALKQIIDATELTGR